MPTLLKGDILPKKYHVVYRSRKTGKRVVSKKGWADPDKATDYMYSLIYKKDGNTKRGIGYSFGLASNKQLKKMVL